MRTFYTDTLIELAEKDPNIVVLEADLMKCHGTIEFKERFPERIFNVGVAEANMIGIAAGFSASGKTPFAATFACFASRRAFDQFFISGNYAKLNIKLVGSDAGITAVYNGGTHMTFEDLGLMRTIPNLIVFEPCDPVSLRKLMLQSAHHKGCTYMRLYRNPVENVYKEDEEFELGKGKVLKDGEDITLIAIGVVLVREALAAAAKLEKKGISAAVIDMHTIKPIDEQLILEYARKTGAIVTCENHQIINGLGSAVSEVLSEGYPVMMKRVGVDNLFGEVGDLDYLKKRFGLDSTSICNKAEKFLKEIK